MNSTGSIIVGSVDTFSQAAIWRDGVPTGLGTFGGFSTLATHVSEDGSVVVGDINDATNGAFVWTAATGMVRADDYLAGFGITLPTGWTIRDCNGISADGQTFTGVAQRSDGIPSRLAFVITVPTPGVLPMAMVALAAIRRRR